MVPHTEPGLPFPDFLSQALIRRELYPVVFKYCGVCGIVDVKEDSSALNALAFRRNMEAGDSALLQQVSHHEGESLPVHRRRQVKRAVVFGKERRP